MQTTDMIDPARVAALNATLNRTESDLPLFGHQAFFWAALPGAELGRDGHPATGKTSGLIPDLGLPRRMWAGGDLTWHVPLQTGHPATRVSRLQSSEIKQGQSGPVGLVRLFHEVFQDGSLCLSDRQDLVYLADRPITSAPPQARTDETEAHRHSFTTTELFRYSALTFNGHRIHYDRDYAREVEGYRGLVVHGPLLAQYLILMAERLLGGLQRFKFRATAPLFDFEPATFCAAPSHTGLELWVRGPDGRQCMSASAQ